MSKPSLPPDITSLFTKALNEHGYAYQNAVLKKAVEMSQHPKAQWSFEVAEYPVGEGKENTKIDFILCQRIRGTTEQIISNYLIAECKRANPAYGIWCFTNIPYITWRDDYRKDNITFEHIIFSDKSKPASGMRAYSNNLGKGNYHLGIEIKTSKRGDSEGHKGAAIENASTQVLKGVNGLVNDIFLKNENTKLSGFSYFIPAIFTTADLYVADGDISTADLISGEVSENWTSKMKKVNWLWYTYSQSPFLRHKLEEEEPKTDRLDLSRKLIRNYLRSIAIVNSNGIEDFLTSDFLQYNSQLNTSI